MPSEAAPTQSADCGGTGSGHSWGRRHPAHPALSLHPAALQGIRQSWLWAQHTVGAQQTFTKGPSLARYLLCCWVVEVLGELFTPKCHPVPPQLRRLAWSGSGQGWKRWQVRWSGFGNRPVSHRGLDVRPGPQLCVCVSQASGRQDGKLPVTPRERGRHTPGPFWDTCAVPREPGLFLEPGPAFRDGAREGRCGPGVPPLTMTNGLGLAGRCWWHSGDLPYRDGRGSGIPGSRALVWTESPP